MKRTNLVFPAFCAFAASIASSQASLLLYEGFNYGVADGTTINGVGSTASGTQENWAVNNTIAGGGSASSVFKTSGLSFGSNFTTTSGALLMTTSYNGGQNNASAATVKLNVSTTGTLWGSYLVNFTSIGLASNGSFLAGIGSSATPADASAVNFKSAMISNAAPTDRKLANGYDPASTASTNFQFLTGTTYLFISKYTNVGTALSAGTTGVGTTWALTLAQYETWLAGGATEGTLNANSSIRVSDAAVTSGTFSFDQGGYLTLRADAPDNNGSQLVATVDELRFGTALGDVYVVPEPSVALLGLGSGLLAFRRRRA